MIRRPEQDERLLKVEEIASRLGVSRRTVYRLADVGQLPAPIRLGGMIRWRASEIERWLDGDCKPVRRARRGGVR